MDIRNPFINSALQQLKATHPDLSEAKYIQCLENDFIERSNQFNALPTPNDAEEAKFESDQYVTGLQTCIISVGKALLVEIQTKVQQQTKITADDVAQLHRVIKYAQEEVTRYSDLPSPSAQELTIGPFIPSAEENFPESMSLTGESPSRSEQDEKKCPPFICSNPIDLWELNAQGHYPLHLAAKNSDMSAIIASQLAVHPELAWAANQVDDNDQIPLHLAAQRTDNYDKAYEIALFLLKLTSFQSINAADNKGNTPFHFSCQAGNMRLVQLLIKKKADIRSVNKAKKTGKQLALDIGHKEIEELLTAIEISTLPPSGPPILVSAEEEKRMAAPSTATPLQGKRPPTSSIRKKEKAEWHPNEKGKILLHHAAEHGDLKTAKELLDNCQNAEILVQMKDKKGQTPLHLAVQSPQEKRFTMVEYLLNQGALVTEPDDNGDTAFHIACEKGSTDIISLLYNQQPNIVRTINEQFRTARELAEGSQHAGIIAVLDELEESPDQNYAASSFSLLGKNKEDRNSFTIWGPNPTPQLADNIAFLNIDFLTAADFKDGTIKLKIDRKGVAFVKQKSFNFSTEVIDDAQNLWITFQPNSDQLKIFLNLFDYPTRRQQDAKSYLIHRANNSKEYYYNSCCNFFARCFAVSREDRCVAAFNILKSVGNVAGKKAKKQDFESKEEPVIEHFNQIRPA